MSETGHLKPESPPSRRVMAALEQGTAWGADPWRPQAPSGGRFQRHIAIGDPQTSFERFLRILDRHELLGEDGRLRQDVSLLSIGDHFDYDGDLEQVREDGRRLLGWLARHPPDQVHILAGNHDLSRVAELAAVTDAGFDEARRLARRIHEVRKDPAAREELAALRRTFTERFPEIPTPKVANRDYGSFTVAQRTLVQSLFLGGRLRLAKMAVARDGRPVLLTHAAVTSGDLAALDLPRESPLPAIATALEQRLDRAVARVSAAWGRGEGAALELGPIYVPGGRGREGGGMLYHRPAHPLHLDKDTQRAPLAPRRFDPRTLPAGALQACGHAGHRKCAEELDEWVSPEARAVPRGGLRTLRSDGEQVTYEMGIRTVPREEAGLFMIDGEMNRVPIEEYPVFDLAGWAETA